MNTVRELLQDKIHEVTCVEPNKSAHDAMQLMADKKIGALLGRKLENELALSL